MALIALGACASGVTAGPIGGVLNTQSGALSLSRSGIDFTSLAPTGVYSGLGGGLAVTSDLSFASPATANFIVLPAASGKHIDLTSIAPGAFSAASCGVAPAPGQMCTPLGSPLSFENTTTGVVASFTVRGDLIDTIGGTTSPVVGLYSLQLAGTNYQSVLATLAAGGSVSTSYSAEFAPPTGATDRLIFGGSLTLSSTGLDFSTSALIGSTMPRDGGFVVAAPSGGSFSPLIGQFGAASDLLFSTVPVGSTPVNLADFLVFANDPSTSANLAQMIAGVGTSAQCGVAPASGQTCTLPGSPFLFSNVSGGSVAEFDVLGYFINGPDLSPYRGVFSFQFANMSYQQVLASLSDGRAIASLYSASFISTAQTSVIAEPETMALVTVALAGLGASLRRKRRAP